MALSQKQVDLLAQGLAGSRTKSGLTKVTGTGQARNVQTKQEYTPAPSTFEQVVGVAGNVLKTGFNVAKGVGSYVTNEIREIPGEAYRTATNVIPTVFGFGARSEIRDINKALDAQSKSIDNVFNDYKSGRITKEEYKQRLYELNDTGKEIRQRSEAVVDRTDPRQAVEDFTDTALLLTTFGMGKIASASVKPGGAFLGKILNPSQIRIVNNVNFGIEKVLKKVPGNYFKTLLAGPNTKSALGKLAIGGGDEIVARTAAEATKQVATKDALKWTANKLFIKYPLTYHQIFQDTSDIATSISKGDFKGVAAIALLNATALVSGPIKATKEFAEKLGLNTKRAMFGTNSFFDELSGRALGKDRTALGTFVNGLKETDPKRFEESIRWMKSLQATNLYAARDNVKAAVDSIEEWYLHHGIKVSDLTPQQLFEGLESYGRTLDVIHRDLRYGIIQGVDPARASSVMLGRWDQKTRNAFADIVEGAGTADQARLLLKDAAENQVAWTHNDTLYAKVSKLLDDATDETLESVAKSIKAIDAQQFVGRGWSKEARQLMKKNGYIPIIPKHSLKKYVDAEKAGDLVSDVVEGGAQTFKPLPGLEQFGGALKKIGLSPEDTTYTVNKMLRDNLDDALQNVDIPVPIGTAKGSWVSQKLSEYMENLPQYPGAKLPAQDARTLTSGEVAKALGVNKDAAKEVQRAILDSYTSMPMSLRGMGDKLVDYAYSAPITGVIQRTYSRIQGTFRYSWNPFFRLQEMAETEILSQAIMGGKVPNVFGTQKVINTLFKKTGKQIDDAAELLEGSGVFKGTLGGEAAQDVVIGRISANLTKTQKRSLAGMALKIADQKGQTLEQMLKESKDEVADALRVIVQYPTKSPLNSPMARTLNLAFFPMRYNLKVTGLAAKALANQPPAVQIGVINGLYDAREWLQSDEGIVWQSENQDAIRLFRWITPYGSIESALKLLNGNKPESIGELGQLGGLPFGIITQMIDSQTDFEVNDPYIDLKTGRVFPEYIPETTKARAATAVQDLIMQLFTYPGRLIGLPGKSQLVRQGVQSVFNVEDEEYRITMPEDGDFSETQRNQLRVLEEAGIRETETPKYQYVFDGYSWNDNGYYIPIDVEEKVKSTSPTSEPERVPVPTRSQVRSAKDSKKSTPASERTARPIQQR